MISMKKLISSILIFILVFTSAAAFAFSDVSSDHWANSCISRLADANIINGYEDGTFRPEANVTRAEFAKMLCLAFELGAQGKDFIDTNGHWAQGYIAKSADVLYAPSDSFIPDESATRAEIAYALANVLSLEDADASGMFSDWHTVSDDMAARVGAAAKHGIIEGYEDGTIRADGSVTRGEMAALLVRAQDFEVPAKPEEKPVEKPEDDKTNSLDHLYTLYPMKDLILINSVANVLTADGETAVKLSYCIAGEEDKVYSTIISTEAETKVAGTKDSLAELSEGDVIVIDTAFHGRVDTIIVVASFGGSKAEASIPESLLYGTVSEYEFYAGKVTKVENKSKSCIITAENMLGTHELVITKKAHTSVFVKRSTSPWQADSTSFIDEGMFVLVRYSDSVATEVAVVK